MAARATRRRAQGRLPDLDRSGDDGGVRAAAPGTTHSSPTRADTEGGDALGEQLDDLDVTADGLGQRLGDLAGAE